MYYVQFCINIKCDFKIRHQTDEFLQQYFSYIMAVSFIGGGNRSTRRKPAASHWQQHIKVNIFEASGWYIGGGS